MVATVAAPGDIIVCSGLFGQVQGTEITMVTVRMHTVLGWYPSMFQFVSFELTVKPECFPQRQHLVAISCE